MKLKATVLLALGLTHLYGANILTNSGFETPAIGNGGAQILGTGSAALTGWTVTGAACGANCVLILDTNYTETSNVGTLGFQAHSGIQSLDLTGAGNTVDGGIQQVVNLTTSVNYLLTFWVGNMDNRATSYPSPSTVQLLINGVSQGNFTNSATTNNANNWAQSTFNFTPTQASNTIQFRNATPGTDNFAGLDDVFLDVAGAAGVPEPATFGLMSLALGGAALLRRRLASR
jgi:hypothetical protein